MEEEEEGVEEEVEEEEDGINPGCGALKLPFVVLFWLFCFVLFWLLKDFTKA